ncbi:MAG: hypothetical protein PHU49_04530 [Syntrophorhabdaceae bacterium]|nr:hypothetical protein [Syntrophorhabdaceae bacterium]MDD5243262.1 hypothetical protein [Syntrophorhabdaceae bacterium]
MKKAFLFLYACSLAVAVVLAGSQAIGAELQKKTTKDIRILRSPSGTGKTATQPQPDTTVKNPQVESVEILPLATDCAMRWQITLRNTNNTPFTKPITIRPYQKKGAATYRGVDAVISPATIPPGQTGSAGGNVVTPAKYTTYRLDIVIDNQVVASQTGSIPVLSHNITVGDFRFQDNKCYVTIINNNTYKDCELLLRSEFATNASPTVWTPGLNFGKDIPGSGSVEQVFLPLPGYNIIKITVQKGSAIITEKSVPIP